MTVAIGWRALIGDPSQRRFVLAAKCQGSSKLAGVGSADRGDELRGGIEIVDRRQSLARSVTTLAGSGPFSGVVRGLQPRQMNAQIVRCLLVLLAGGASMQCQFAQGRLGGGTFGSASANDGIGADPALVTLFQRLSYADFPSDRHWGDPFELLSRENIDLASMPRTASPDHEWLPGWPGGLKGGALADAFVQGAVNKTWQAQCYEDYTDYRGRWKSIEDELRARLEALRATKNPYLRIQALFEMWNQLGATEEKLPAPPTANPGRWSGIRHDLAQELIALHRELGRLPAIGEWYRSSKRNVELGRSLSDDDELERDLFCAYGAEHGTHRTPALLRTASYPKLGGVVRPVDWDKPDRQTRITAALDAASSARATSVLSDAETDVLAFDLMHGSYTAGQVVRVDGVVDSIKAGKAALLSVKVTNVEVGYQNCKSTGEAEAVEADGRIRYGKVCDAAKETTEATVSVSLDNWPSSIKLRKGDVVRVYGTVRTWKEGPERRAGRGSLVQKSLRLDRGYVAQARRKKSIVCTFDGSVE